jgi:hypothetical protein
VVEGTREYCDTAVDGGEAAAVQRLDVGDGCDKRAAPGHETAPWLDQHVDGPAP